MTRTELIFYLLDLFESGAAFTVAEIKEKFGISETTVKRAIGWIRDNRKIEISYDRIQRKWRKGTYTKMTRKERDRRSYLNRREKILLQKKLCSTTGKKWKEIQI